ncbi:hypothetical protein [Methanobrevibacter filiformis]|uniref:Uncharacterized protein n=1 Tax=Methanobrevibacter filiformis TaxID=55758 RepID=A0A166C0W7_9EURY|nr:hypothetical protein [Methanobrevibacter filiformis]KZX10457.1 hypothetical protein MBFIL_17560 [Methanobrevibacter filiformis]
MQNYHNSFKINLINGIEGMESSVIYLTKCYVAPNIVKMINESAKGITEEEGWD